MSNTWTPSVEVWKKHNLSAATFGTVFKRKPNTPWIRRNSSSKLEINISHKDFHVWLVSAVEKSKQHKNSKEKKAVSVERLNSDYSGEQNKAPESEYLDPELIELEKLSARATLEAPILANEEKHYSIQNKKVKMKREAGEAIDSHTANFLYLSYMEKTNVEIIRSPKKIQPQIETELKTYISRSLDIQKIEDESLRSEVQTIVNSFPLKKMSTDIVNFLMREQEEIIRNNKRVQKEGLDSYYENLDQLTFA